MGLVGLQNLGNTCYMNSALQCLSNYKLLKDFFLTLAFKEEINLENPLGTKGLISVRFAELLDNLWNRSQPDFSPWQFKQCIGNLSTQFYGYAQNDSMEFLTLLLDKLHEDLNRVQTKIYEEIPDV